MYEGIYIELYVFLAHFLFNDHLYEGAEIPFRRNRLLNNARHSNESVTFIVCTFADSIFLQSFLFKDLGQPPDTQHEFIHYGSIRTLST